MTERPNAVLGLLVAAAASVGALVLSGLAALGGAGVAGISAMIVGIFSACVFFLAELDRVPVASLVIVSLALASALAFARTLLAYRREQRLLQALPLEPLNDPRMLGLAQAAGARRVYLAPARRPAAFCFGLLRPRVVVTAGLLAALDEEEQAAAIWHEGQHARAREPLKCLLARLVAVTFFWVPALHDLRDRYLIAKELAADRLAIEKTSRRALVGALSEVVGSPTPAAAVGIADVASARIDRVFDPHASLPPLFTRARLAASVLATALLVAVLQLPFSVGVGETGHLHAMLTSTSIHGLPGMAAGLVVNAAAIVGISLFARRFLPSRALGATRSSKNLVLELVLISAHLTAPRGTEAGPKPRFRR